MISGFIVVAILSGLPNAVARIVTGAPASSFPLYSQPDWLPVMEFPWWICFGTIVTFGIAIVFKTDHDRVPPTGG
jgi:hypothetical protein